MGLKPILILLEIKYWRDCSLKSFKFIQAGILETGVLRGSSGLLSYFQVLSFLYNVGFLNWNSWNLNLVLLGIRCLLSKSLEWFPVCGSNNWLWVLQSLLFVVYFHICYGFVPSVTLISECFWGPLTRFLIWFKQRLKYKVLVLPFNSNSRNWVHTWKFQFF